MGPVILSMLCWVRIEGKEGQMPIDTGQQKKAALNTIHDAQHLQGWSQNITAFKGGSVSFPRRRYNATCEVVSLGKEKNEVNKRDVFFSHGPDSLDNGFTPYTSRLEIHTNCSSILKNVQPEDEGWYCVTWDFDQIVCVYLRVTEPVFNISIIHICTKDGVQMLQCNTTGNENQSLWTLNGQRWTESDIFPEKINIAQERTYSFYQGNSSCDVSVLQQAGINLTYSDCKAKTDTGLGIGPVIGIGFPVLVIVLVVLFLYCKRLWCFKRSNGL